MSSFSDRQIRLSLYRLVYACINYRCQSAVGGTCTVKARNNKLGGDPCRGTFKYLKVCAECVPGKIVISYYVCTIMYCSEWVGAF